MQTAIVVAAIYIGVNLILTALATWVQRKFVGEKKILEVSMVAETDAGTGLAPGRPLRAQDARQVLHQELDGGGVRVEPVGALGEAVTLVVVHPQLAVDALAVEGGLDLLGPLTAARAGRWRRG